MGRMRARLLHYLLARLESRGNSGNTSSEGYSPPLRIMADKANAYGPGRDAMKEKNSQSSHVSRRRFIKSTAGAGAVFAQALAVPPGVAAPDTALPVVNNN